MDDPCAKLEQLQRQISVTLKDNSNLQAITRKLEWFVEKSDYSLHAIVSSVVMMMVIAGETAYLVALVQVQHWNFL